MFLSFAQHQKNILWNFFCPGLRSDVSQIPLQPIPDEPPLYVTRGVGGQHKLQRGITVTVPKAESRGLSANAGTATFPERFPAFKSDFPLSDQLNNN